MTFVMPRVQALKKRVVAKWLYALRSGGYQQTSSSLRSLGDSGESFCCLGVLCELHRIETGLGEWDGSRYSLIGDSESGDCAVLPEFVRDWLGVNVEPNPIWLNDKSLAEINDAGTPFDVIAEIIESAARGRYVEDSQPQLVAK